MSDTENALARAGTLVCVDRGDYSEYEVTGFFVVLKDFTPMEYLKKYLEVLEESWKLTSDKDRFLAFLIAEGLLLEIEYRTLYLGSYRTFGDASFS